VCCLIVRRFGIVVASVESNLAFDDQASYLVQGGVRVRREVPHELDRFGDGAFGLDGDDACRLRDAIAVAVPAGRQSCVLSLNGSGLNAGVSLSAGSMASGAGIGR
jgi:hypothetical protein